MHTIVLKRTCCNTLHACSTLSGIATEVLEASSLSPFPHSEASKGRRPHGTLYVRSLSFFLVFLGFPLGEGVFLDFGFFFAGGRRFAGVSVPDPMTTKTFKATVFAGRTFRPLVPTGSN